MTAIKNFKCQQEGYTGNIKCPPRVINSFSEYLIKKGYNKTRELVNISTPQGCYGPAIYTDKYGETVFIDDDNISGRPIALSWLYREFLNHHLEVVFQKAIELRKICQVFLCGSFVIGGLHELGDPWDDIDFALYFNPRCMQDENESFKDIREKLKELFPGQEVSFSVDYPMSAQSFKMEVGPFEMNLLLLRGRTEFGPADDIDLLKYRGIPVVPLRHNLKLKLDYGRDKDFIQLYKIAADVLSPEIPVKNAE